MTDITVGIDGSDASEPVLDRALLEAERIGLPLRVVHAWSTPTLSLLAGKAMLAALPSSEDGERSASGLVADVIERAMSRRVSGPLVTVSADVQQGDPGRVLCTRGRDAALLVVGASGHGRRSAALLGSVTSHVLHHASCPVMVVPHSPQSHRFARVLVGVDGSPSSRAAFAWGLATAESLDCPLVALHAWQINTAPLPIPYSNLPAGATYEQDAQDWLRHEVAKAREGHETVKVSYQVPYGPAAGALLNQAGPDDLLVLGSRGHGGFSGLLLGSVAAQCATHARGAVVVVKQPTAVGSLPRSG